MTLARTTPRWAPWPMRRGANLPQVFWWEDDEGLVAIEAGIEVRLRIVWPDGAVRESVAGVDPDFVLLEQGNALTRGHMLFRPSLELVASLPIHPAARYRIEARQEEFRWVFLEGEISMSPGDAENAG